MSIYLDCNATGPLVPAVREAIISWFTNNVGNAGSGTHEYGVRANEAVQKARAQVAHVVGAQPEEVVFTSGATESNNLALLGLAPAAERLGRKHIISSSIEHKSVLEPLEILRTRGFSITLLPPNSGGYVEARDVANALRPDTIAVSIMHVNNETGVEQPIVEIAREIDGHEAYLHVDAAQGFGKSLAPLVDTRIDFISISSHKIYGPFGVGALITRKRGTERAPLTPLFVGGGQEQGLRPGTLPVPLIIGFGTTSELALAEHEIRMERCLAMREAAMTALTPIGIQVNGDSQKTLPHVLNFSMPGLDSGEVMVALKDIVAVSGGSACTSQSYSPSHVLVAMGLAVERVEGAVRMSWCHMTEDVEWEKVRIAIEKLL